MKEEKLRRTINFVIIFHVDKRIVRYVTEEIDIWSSNNADSLEHP
jgi:hypothetical protein